MNKTTEENKQTDAPTGSEQRDSSMDMMMMFMMICCGLPLLLFALPLLGVSWNSPNSWLIIGAAATVIILCMSMGRGARHRSR